MSADGRGLVEEELTGRVIGVFYEVYNELGGGFLESVYEGAMAIALAEDGLAVERQVPIPVRFRGRIVGDFRADLVVEGRVLLELKACRALEPAHESQVLHYLKATAVPVGLLLNFGSKPIFKRFVLQSASIRVNPRPSS
ncbi:MAG: GxxExxY protein [Phycisphaerales bacterium]